LVSADKLALTGRIAGHPLRQEREGHRGRRTTGVRQTGKSAGGMKRVIIALLAGVLPGSAFSPIAANPGGGRSSIRIESLGMPLGEVGSRATAVDRSGIVVLGDAYWNAT